MGECVRNIGGVTYIDMERLWHAVDGVAIADKLAAILAAAGVTFFDDKRQFVNRPVVAVTGFGGFPVSFDAKTPEGQVVLNGRAAPPADHLAEMQKTRGLAGMITNLNSGKHDAAAMDELTTKLGHFSKLRTTIIDLHIFGYPAAIEANFMRLYKYAVHVGCLTVTRNAAQANPPWVLLDPAHLPAAQELRAKFTVDKPALKGEALKDYQEGVFGLQPKNAAMALMLNIDLNNLKGTMGDIADPGQEIAWRRLLALLNNQMHALFPAFFKPTAEYGLELPKWWA
jgi:hypothetical protein